MLDATFFDVTALPEPSAEAQDSCKQYAAETQDMLQQIADLDGLKDRSAMLALLELEKRSRTHGFSTGECAEGYKSLLHF